MDRFNLEEDINNFYAFITHLDTLHSAILETSIDKDTISNALMGISTMLSLHIEKTFDTFKQVHSLDQYRKNII